MHQDEAPEFLAIFFAELAVHFALFAIDLDFDVLGFGDFAEVIGFGLEDRVLYELTVPKLFAVITAAGAAEAHGLAVDREDEAIAGEDFEEAGVAGGLVADFEVVAGFPFAIADTDGVEPDQIASVFAAFEQVIERDVHVWTGGCVTESIGAPGGGGSPTACQERQGRQSQ